MKIEISKAIKSAYSKYGLKPESIEKIGSIIEARLAATGTIEPEKLQESINEVVKLYEPMAAILQSEIDSRIPKQTPAAIVPEVKPAETDTALAMKAIMDKLAALEAKDASNTKAIATKTILDSAIALAKTKGASNEKLLSKASRFASIEDGATPEQVSDLLLKEYNDLQSAVSGNGVAPSIPSNTLSDAEVATARAAAIEKSAKAYQEKNNNI